LQLARLVPGMMAYRRKPHRARDLGASRARNGRGRYHGARWISGRAWAGRGLAIAVVLGQCCARATRPISGCRFQTCDPPEPRLNGAGRVEQLRQLLVKAGLDALLVPRADEHQGEYVPASAERLKWLTGFSGSAGLAAVGRTTAALFVDGRYVVQAPAHVDRRIFEVLQAPAAKLEDWLGPHREAGGGGGLHPKV